MHPEPFLRLQRRGSRIVQTGDPAASLGQPVAGRAPGQPDGVFAGWRWEDGQLKVVNDRYGFYPLYYYADDGDLALSPSVLQLVALRGGASLDPAALAVFLRLGFFVGNDTPFRGIRALPPNAVVSWEGDRLQMSGERPRVAANGLARREARDGFIDLFRAAVARRIPGRGPVTVPLSGGKDSRHILLELFRAGVRPTCVTVDLPHTGDLQVARALTDALGVPHVAIEPSASRLDTELRKNRATSFCADEHGWYMALVDYLRAHPSTIFDGIGGDVLSRSSNLSEARIALFRTGQLEDLARGLWPRSTEGVVRKLLPRDEYDRFHPDLAVSRLVEELRDHMDAPNPVGSFFFFNRTRREIALIPYALLRDAGPVHAPFLDHELYDLLAGLSAESLVDRTLHADVINQAYPEMSHIPWVERRPKVATWAERWRFGRDMIGYLSRGPAPRLVRLSYVIPRALRYMADHGFEWSGNLPTYLIQLERMVGGSVTTR
jgi:asparagine synthase (glutamine-hydrolysing)